MLAIFTGILGIAANCIIYQQKNGKNLLLWKLISDVLWLLHYLFLSAYSGCAVALIGVFRELVFYRENKKGRKNPFFLFFFIMVTICSSVLTWKGIASVFPAAASIISIAGFWKANPKISRKLAFPISGLMLSYDLTCNSHMGIVNEILTMCATAIAIIHNRKVDKNG